MSIIQPEVRIKTIEMIVDELIKPQPNEQIVRSLMKQVDLTYYADPVKRINSVLEALHQKTNVYSSSDQNSENERVV